MPARTNIFQRLVAAIHQDLGPRWQLSESRLLVETFTGAVREVEVVAQASVGGYPLLMGIEARDGKRPADVRWVEQSRCRRNMSICSPTRSYFGALLDLRSRLLKSATPRDRCRGVTYYARS